MTHPEKSAHDRRDLSGTPWGALLRLYPRRWRERYGDEFALILRGTPPGPATVFDVARGALDARVREMRPGPLVRWGLLSLGAAVVGWLNLHTTDDVQPVAAALLVFGFGFGAHRPARAWLYALVLFAAVPLTGVGADVAADRHLDVRILESVVALIPALLGACSGALVGWGLRRAMV
jgi:hypothetical protein